MDGVTYSNSTMACARAEASSIAICTSPYKSYNQFVHVFNRGQIYLWALPLGISVAWCVMPFVCIS